MLFLLPASIVPAVVAAALVLTRTPAFVRGRIPLPRLVALLGDGWYSLGPAVVLVVAGSPASPRRVAGYVAAFARPGRARCGCHALPAVVRGSDPPRESWRPMVWTFGVDSVLSTVGVLIAASAIPRPGLALLALPMIGLLGLFARERHERLDQVLT